jgi:hypothetical protein
MKMHQERRSRDHTLVLPRLLTAVAPAAALIKRFL